jgi:hypothetical protein
MDGNKTNVTASASLLTVSGGSLTVSAGVTLQNNKNAGNGGGVCVSGSSSSFTMDGGEISGNTAYSIGGDGYGGGVYVTGSGNFKMTDGSISGNVADGKLMEGGGGGGVCVSGNGSNFTMSGGTIGGNTANSGGGVHVKDSGKFTKENGGTIYGSDNSTEKNSAYADDYGHAASVSGSKKRNSTAGTGTDLDSSETTNWD